jgi:hypothetical protein
MKRPATDESLDTKHRKRSKCCQERTVSKNNRQHRPRRKDCLPINRCQSRECSPSRAQKPSRDAVSSSEFQPHDLLTSHRLDWSALARFLNHTAKFFHISSRTDPSANGDRFPTNGAPQLEDYMICGLVWAQWYFMPDWFGNIEDDDSSRCLCSESATPGHNSGSGVEPTDLRLSLQTILRSSGDRSRRFRVYHSFSFVDIST